MYFLSLQKIYSNKRCCGIFILTLHLRLSRKSYSVAVENKVMIIMKKVILLFLGLLPMLSYAQTPRDSVGIYAIHENEVTQVEKITHQRIKGTGGLGAAFSFGISKIKAKLEFKGATSNNVFSQTAKFRIYFGNPPIQEIQKLYMFSSNYSIKDFDVAQFEKKKNCRMLTGVSTSLLGSTVGVESAPVDVKTTEIRTGVYDVDITAEPGEYCIIFTGGGIAGMGGVFDFTIK